MSVATNFQPQTISTMVRNYITQELAYDQAGFTLTNESHLVEQHVIDSMGIMRLITFIEEEFNLVFTPEDLRLENFVTLDAITAFIVRRLTQAE